MTPTTSAFATHGALVVVGGGPRAPEIRQRFVDLAGVGIDESTALVIDGHDKRSVIGASVAVVYDARHATVTAPSSHVLGATGLVLSVLPPGSSYDPATGRATLP